MTPNAYNAEEAATALGVDLFYLAHALRNEASSRFEAEAARVRGYDRPNFGQARALLRAAEACETAYDQECDARSAASAPLPLVSLPDPEQK